MSTIPEELITDRLALRTPRESDAEALGEAVRASLPELARWLDWARVRARLQDVDDLSDKVRAAIEDHATGRVWRWYIHPDEDPDAIWGEVLLFPHHWSAHRVVEYVVWVRSDRAGLGVATEASHAVFEWLFDGADAAFVEARVFPTNARSRVMLRAMGFELHGRLADYDRLVLQPYSWARTCHRRTLRALRLPPDPDRDP